MNLPVLILKGLLSLIKSTIETKAGFNIEHVDVLKHIEKINVSCLFLASKEDNLIKFEHTEEIYR